MKKYNVAVIGATGNVGRETLNILSERSFPIKNIYAIASSSSIGSQVSFGEDKVLDIIAIDNFDFSSVDIAFFAAGSHISEKYAKKAIENGCVVIDNSSLFRMEKNVPLIVPEVNADQLSKDSQLIANPNCSTIQLVTALNLIQQEYGIKRIVTSTYQSVSGAGREAMDELYKQTKSIYVNDLSPPTQFLKRIAFNIIPEIDEMTNNGYTKEELKMINETKKILGQDIEVTATCVRVPVFVGHSLSANIETEEDISLDDFINTLSKTPGVQVCNKWQEGTSITPIEVVQEDNVYISRIRKDFSIKSGFNMWIVADNIRKGAALNAVQIAELCIKL